MMKRFYPIGVDPKQERKVYLFLLATAAGFSLIWFIQFYHALGRLYEWDYRIGDYILRENVMMPPFLDVLAIDLHGFLAIAISSVLRIVYHYSYFYRGSKSIYLMRRLPDRMELHRRCITIPMLEAVSALLIAGVLFLLYYWFYIAVTPETCLIPNQWTGWFGLS